MILWCSKNIRTETDIPGYLKLSGPRSWRWIFETSWNDSVVWKRGFVIGFVEQVKFYNEDWRLANQYYSFWINSHWSWGRKHDYWDGPIDSFNLGLIHFCWSGAWCVKCAG